MKHIINSITLFLLLTQPLYSNIDNLKFEKFDNVPGHMNERIVDIKQDSIGFIWIATSKNIYRFDGNEFIPFTVQTKTKKTIPGLVYNSLFVDSKGKLWLTTNNGVYRFNDTLNIFDHFKHPTESEVLNIVNVVHSMVESKNSGIFYFLTEFGTVYSIDHNGTIKAILQLKVDGCKSLFIDKNENLWISSNSTIYCYNIKTNYTNQINLFDNSDFYNIEIWNMFVDDSLIFIASSNCEVVVYNLNTREYLVEPKVSTKNAYCILKNKQGNVMFGTTNGIEYFEPESNKIIKLEPKQDEIKGLSSRSVFALFYDRQGNLWVGTQKGINISYKLNRFDAIGLKNNNLLTPNSVSTITKDSRGFLWLGYSEEGIDIFNSNNDLLESISHIEGILPNNKLVNIASLYNDNKNNIWIATYSNGLINYDIHSQKFKQYYFNKGEGAIKGNFIKSIAEDDQNRIWLSVFGYGIDFLDKETGKFNNFIDRNKNLPINIINKWPFCTYIDSKQNLWIGSTYGAACLSLKTNAFKIFTRESSDPFRISNNNIFTINEDSKGRIWLGSLYGLNVIFPDGRIKVFTTDDGLSDNQIVSIIEDNNGDLWVGTTMGLSSIRYNSKDSLIIKSYTAQSGLHANKFNNNSVYKDSDGSLYFGGLEGYTKFHPDSIEYNNSPPKVVLTDFKLFNKSLLIKESVKDDSIFKLDKSITYTKKITLKQSQNIINISYAALNYINPLGNKYAYILDGFDKAWVECGSRNNVTYTNLSPGKYVFKVKASNNDGVWSKTPLELEIQVNPPFLKSIYAITIYALLVFALILYIIKIVNERQRIEIQSEQKELLNSLKTQFFVDVSHELKTPLTLIVSPLRNILERSQSILMVQIKKDDIVTIYRNVYRLLRITLQLLDFRKVELNKARIKVARYNIIPFIHSIIQYFDYPAKANNINIEFQYNRDSDLSLYFDPDKLDKIIYNILSNAIKHAPENSTVKIRVLEAKLKNKDTKNYIPSIQIEIEDEGVGIEAKRQEIIFERFCESLSNEKNKGEGTGIGLSMAREYVLMHHGEISVVSPCSMSNQNERRGARFIVNLPADEGFFAPEQITTDLTRHEEIILENQLAIIDYKEPEDDLEEIEYDSDSLNVGNKVLIIEDDPELRNHLKKELKKYHFIIEAKDGETGIKLTKELIPDLIISDLMLPGINGYEVVSTLKKQQETSHIPIIVLTAKTEQSDEIEAYTTGADAFMKKPFHMKTLIHLIESLIENRINLRQRFLSSYGIVLREVVPTETDEKFIENFLKIIYNNISDHNLNVELFTRELCMSRAQLYKKVNAIANTSVKLFIRKVRLTEAIKLLEGGKYNITEIAFMVGFDNLPYFSKCFQEEYGVSPSKYLANKKSN